MTKHRRVHGFTLVEISIVMIVIGLLIGGTFGGLKLVENMRINRTIQDLKSIESSAVTFKFTYGRIPGDLRNPSTRLRNCLANPCARGGNGDNTLDANLPFTQMLTPSMERFVFWHHLKAADILDMKYNNISNTEWGVGQPKAPFGNGYRVSLLNQNFGANPSYRFSGTVILNMMDDSNNIVWPHALFIPCHLLQRVDVKMDDDKPYNGPLQSWGCAVLSGGGTNGGGGGSGVPTNPYVLEGAFGAILYDLKGL